MARCFWVPAGDELYERYHDQEWGFPLTDDQRLFEKLSLEGFQAGLAWRTVLAKRDRFRQVFADFQPDLVASFDDAKIIELVADPGIIRHRGKIEAVISNAALVPVLQAEHGSLARYLWQFAPVDPPDRFDEESLRARVVTAEAEALARDLRRRGWRFLGPTSAYAFMQSVGIVNDHEESCPARAPVEKARAKIANWHRGAGESGTLGTTHDQER